MKNLSLTSIKTRIFAFLLLQFFALQTFAQDKGLDIDVNIGEDDNVWYKNPWVLVGIAAFVIILVLALRGGKKS